MNRVFEFKVLFLDKFKGSVYNGIAVVNFYFKKKKTKKRRFLVNLVFFKY